MRTLTFNENCSISGGSFTEIGTYVGTGLWAKVTVTYVAKALITTGCLPYISPYAAVAGLVVYVGAGTAVGAAADSAIMKVTNSAYSLFSLNTEA